LLSKAVDTLLEAYARNDIPLTPASMSWLERLEEQCRSRNEELDWRNRELRVDRLLKQRQFAEKFLARINLLLRRNLYNISRFDLPVQYLTSDPSESPVLVAYRFLNQPPVSLLGMVIELDEFCQQLEDTVSKAYWVSGDVLVRIGHDFSQQIPEKLVEERILDPWAPQFTLRAMPRDYSAFERRSLYKNLLYLMTVLVTGLSCILVLFFGNRALKEQERLAKLRSDFLTNVTHELRTPLTAIRLHAETLERQLLPADASVSSSAETIIEETDRLSRLISDVLEFTRLENDKRQFVWESVDLVTVIQESLQLFSQQFAEEGFETVVDMPECLILQKADRAALKQTAVNLISNAIKFSREEKSLRLHLAQVDRRALWEVEDRGTGIAPEDLALVFDKFFRGSKLDPAISGTGLGLTLCKAFVEAHGGTITVASAQGRGTKFSITLPMGEEPEEISDPGTENQEVEKTYVQNPHH
jgi:signal transduction histidine kinase